MKTQILTLAMLVSLTLSGASFAACTAPEDPAIPAGTAASGADMLKAKKAVETYVSAAEEYMGCGVPVAMQERMSTRMEKVVGKFNDELKAYKAKG